MQLSKGMKPFFGWLSPDVMFLGLWFVPSHDPSHRALCEGAGTSPSPSCLEQGWFWHDPAGGQEPGR